jgi:hypothetical protein
LVTYLVLENPIRHSTWLRARTPLVSLAIGLCLVFVSLGVATWMLDAHQTPVAPQQPAPELVFPTPSH